MCNVMRYTIPPTRPQSPRLLSPSRILGSDPSLPLPGALPFPAGLSLLAGTNAMPAPRTFTFHNAGYWFIGILVVALLGFVPSYFPNVSGRQVEFSVYTHLHATVMVLWLALLITQPFLIKHGHHAWHRRLGRISLGLLPLVLLAGLLLIHHRLGIVSDEPMGIRFFIAFKDLIIIGPLYALAMVWRKNAAYHARFMVGSSFQLLEPGLVRALFNCFPFPNPVHAAILTWLVIDGLLVFLIVKDRHLARGKWIFRLVLGMTLTVQVFLIAGGPTLPWFVRFTDWFAALNLT